MTLLIELPGVLTDTTGLQRIIITTEGFPSDGLTDLFLFEDGSGTSPENAISGRGVGSIEAVQTTNNAYSWLSGGGIGLQGTQIMSAPASYITGPWSMVMAGAMVGSVGAAGPERLGGLMGHREYAESPPRGVSLYMRGGTDWNSGTPDPYYTGRAQNNGAQGTISVLAPSGGLAPIAKRLLHVLSYDGTGMLTATIYNADGVVVASKSWAASEGQFGLAAGELRTSLRTSVGLGSATFPHTNLQVEAAANYSRVLTSDDIPVILAKVKGLGASRGRAWV